MGDESSFSITSCKFCGKESRKVPDNEIMTSWLGKPAERVDLEVYHCSECKKFTVLLYPL